MMALIPLRDGKPLETSGSVWTTKELIVLWQGTNGNPDSVIGRRELLQCLFAACGCSANHRSTKGKCNACSSVSQWAQHGVSRRLLRFVLLGNNGYQVQGRGTQAFVKVEQEVINGAGSEWGQPRTLVPDDIISIEPLKTTGCLQIKFVSLVEVDGGYKVTTGSSKDPLGVPPKETHLEDSNSCEKRTQPKGMAEDCPGSRSHGSSRQTQGSSVETRGRKSSCPQEIVEDPTGTVPSKKLKIDSPKPLTPKIVFRLFLVPLGQDMSSTRRRILSEKVESLGAHLVGEFRQASHLVISDQVSMGQLCESLGVVEQELRKHIEEQNVECVSPRWITTAMGTHLVKPDYAVVWLGGARKAEATNQDQVGQVTARRNYPRNQEIAELFRNLSNLHQSCPLADIDMWKAYMFRVVAGRLTQLDFEISGDPATLERLRGIKGIGSGSFDKIKEYLEVGSISRIEAFKTDPARVAMKNLKDIWGVGRVKALELVERGHRTIEDVRSDILNGGRFLDRNQLVGVDCYEDILEEMEREEVEVIGRIVAKAAQEILPGVEVQVMGSYRRGKKTCGDVDVHISHPSIPKELPQSGLGRIVDHLWREGHVAYHLTFLTGMATGSSPTDYIKSSRSIPNDAWATAKGAGYMSSKGTKSSSYMGVFHSPTHASKRRRVDIKFYPYRERIFASLYFTGNGFFNRSMRQWAKRKFNFTLNARGLYFGGTVDRVMEATKEEEVFERLGLVYKGPIERDSFDAVEPKGDDEIDFQMTEQEFYSETRSHVWVN